MGIRFVLKTILLYSLHKTLSNKQLSENFSSLETEITYARNKQ